MILTMTDTVNDTKATCQRLKCGEQTCLAPASASHSHFWLTSDQTHLPPFVSTTSFESNVLDELAAPELELDC